MNSYWERDKESMRERNRERETLECCRDVKRFEFKDRSESCSGIQMFSSEAKNGVQESCAPFSGLGSLRMHPFCSFG